MLPKRAQQQWEDKKADINIEVTTSDIIYNLLESNFKIHISYVKKCFFLFEKLASF